MAEHKQERFIHVPLEAVFEALTEPGRLRAWSGADLTLDARVGGQYVVLVDGGELRGSVEVFVRPQRLQIRFDDGDLDLRLAPSLGGTRVELSAPPHPLWADALVQMERAFGQPGRW